jgi:hypothetical protein
MAEPKLQIEQRLDEIEVRLNDAEARSGRIEDAINTMAQWLVQAQTGFGVKDAIGIAEILRGEFGIVKAPEEGEPK